MSEIVPKAYLIFCEHRLVLDKHPYESWRAIQDAYPDYKASFEDFAEEELVEYFADDYGADDSKWPFAKRAISEFFCSREAVLVRDDRPK